MYAHLTVVQLPPDQLDMYVNSLRTSGIPALKEQPGYEAALVLADPQSGKAIAIAFFQTEADRQATEESGFFADAYKYKTGSLLDLSRSTPEYYQVRIADGTFHADDPVHFAPRTNDNVSNPPPGPIPPG